MTQEVNPYDTDVNIDDEEALLDKKLDVSAVQNRIHFDVLLARVDARLAGLTSWMERLSRTVEKLAESSQRIAVVEEKAAEAERKIEETKSQIEVLEKAQEVTTRQMVRLSVISGVTAAALAAILTASLPHMFEKLFN